MTDKKRAPRGSHPNAEQTTQTNKVKSSIAQNETKGKSEFWYDESVCKLYGAGQTCQLREPHWLPSQPCCNDCMFAACPRRCINLKGKCGQSVLARKILYQRPEVLK